MKNLQQFTTLFLASLAFAFLTLSTPVVSAEKVELEKCVGIVKSGLADGQTVIDGNKVDWLLVPAGACMKLVGGKVIIDE